MPEGLLKQFLSSVQIVKVNRSNIFDIIKTGSDMNKYQLKNRNAESPTSPYTDAVSALHYEANQQKLINYEVMINNKIKIKSLVTIGPKGFSDSIQGYLDYMGKSVTGYQGLRAMAKGNEKIYIIFKKESAEAIPFQVTDPINPKSKDKALIMYIDPAYHNKIKFKLEPIDSSDLHSSKVFASGERVFTHEFAHLLQAGGYAPRYYSKNPIHQPKANYPYREGDAVRFANDVAYEQGEVHFRRYYMESGLGRLLLGRVVDTPDRIIARSGDYLITYASLKNKRDYLPLEMIRQLKPNENETYHLKNDAKGTLVYISKSDKYYSKMRLYHYSEIQLTEIQEGQDGVDNMRKQLEQIRRDFNKANTKMAENIESRFNSTKRHDQESMVTAHYDSMSSDLMR